MECHTSSMQAHLRHASCSHQPLVSGHIRRTRHWSRSVASPAEHCEHWHCTGFRPHSTRQPCQGTQACHEQQLAGPVACPCTCNSLLVPSRPSHRPARHTRHLSTAAGSSASAAASDSSSLPVFVLRGDQVIIDGRPTSVHIQHSSLQPSAHASLSDNTHRNTTSPSSSTPPNHHHQSQQHAPRPTTSPSPAPTASMSTSQFGSRPAHTDPSTTGHEATASPPPAPLAAVTSSTSTPTSNTPALPLSAQRQQIRFAALLFIPSILIAGIHGLTAFLDAIQGGSLFAVLGLFHIMEQVAGIQGGASSAAAGAGVAGASDLPPALDQSGSEFPSDMPGDMGPPESSIPGHDPTLANPGDLASAVTAAVADDSIAHSIVSVMANIQSAVLEIWNAAFDAESALVSALLWLEDSRLGRLITVTLKAAPVLWAAWCCWRATLVPLQPHVAATNAAAAAWCKQRAVAAWSWVLAGAQAVHAAATKQRVDSTATRTAPTTQHSAGFSNTTLARTDTATQGPTATSAPDASQSTQQAQRAQHTLQSLPAPKDMNDAVRHIMELPALPLLCPPAETVLRAALGLGAAAACIITVESSAPTAAVLGLVSTSLAAVQVFAALVYLWQAMRHTSTKFFTDHHKDILSQVSVLLVAQSSVQAAIVWAESEFNATVRRTAQQLVAQITGELASASTAASATAAAAGATTPAAASATSTAAAAATAVATAATELAPVEPLWVTLKPSVLILIWAAFTTGLLWKKHYLPRETLYYALLMLWFC